MIRGGGPRVRSTSRAPEAFLPDMNAQALRGDQDSLFELLLEVLESTAELCAMAGRSDRLAEIDARCRRAAELSGQMLDIRD